MCVMRIFRLIFTLLSAFCLTAAGQDYKNWVQQAPRLPDEYFSSDAARGVVANVLSYQLPTGAWPKNINFFHEHCERELSAEEGTIDNSATTTEIRFLMRYFLATGDSTALRASLRGIAYLLGMQYENGGWPQYWPRRDHYHARITFNDNAMVNVMNMLRQVYEQKSPFLTHVPTDMLLQARLAFDKGVECILKCQIRQDGKPTVWCQQHDEVSLQPVGARSYELPGLCHHESVSIILLLMSLEEPSAEVKDAVENAVAWLKRSRLYEADSTYRWARYYNIDDNRPFFCGRDGVKKYRLDEIEEERQHGYSWYGRQGDRVLQRYEEWKAKHYPDFESKD